MSKHHRPRYGWTQPAPSLAPDLFVLDELLEKWERDRVARIADAERAKRMERRRLARQYGGEIPRRRA